jgi:hypothetical protein
MQRCCQVLLAASFSEDRSEELPKPFRASLELWYSEDELQFRDMGMRGFLLSEDKSIALNDVNTFIMTRDDVTDIPIPFLPHDFSRNA